MDPLNYRPLPVEMNRPRIVEELPTPTIQEETYFEEEDKEWIVIHPEQAEALLEEGKQLLNEASTGVHTVPEFLEKAIENLEGNWTLIDPQEERYCRSWWACTAALPATALTVGTLQQMAGDTMRFAALAPINVIKQFEIKNFAYAISCLPLLQSIAEKVYYDKSDEPFMQKVFKAVQEIDKVELCTLLFSTGLSLASAGVHSLILKMGLIAFDISGHVMTKVVSTHLFARGMAQKEKEHGSSHLRTISAAVYSASDALMLHETALRYHTPQETVGGIVWGLLNLTVAYILARRFGDHQTTEVTAPHTQEINPSRGHINSHASDLFVCESSSQTDDA